VRPSVNVTAAEDHAERTHRHQRYTGAPSTVTWAQAARLRCLSPEPGGPVASAIVNPFGHIDLRVSDLEAALPFYEALLPALGFTERYHGEEWKVWATTEPLPSTAYFAVTESPEHVPNETRIAFWVAADEDVDRVAVIARDAGAIELSGPKSMPYSPGYYAVYFADPLGNRLEVYVRPS
jgi:catechol 2,3-dioxygenase-like lactoylglutathione lyase family enzyme